MPNIGKRSARYGPWPRQGRMIHRRRTADRLRASRDASEHGSPAGRKNRCTPGSTASRAVRAAPSDRSMRRRSWMASRSFRPSSRTRASTPRSGLRVRSVTAHRAAARPAPRPMAVPIPGSARRNTPRGFARRSGVQSCVAPRSQPAIASARLGATDTGSPRAARSPLERSKGRVEPKIGAATDPQPSRAPPESSLSGGTGDPRLPRSRGWASRRPPSGGSSERRVPNGSRCLRTFEFRRLAKPARSSAT